MEKMQPQIWTDGLSCQHGQLSRACNICELESEIADLKAQLEDLAEAFTVLWIANDHATWDAKAVERFNSLLEMYNA